MERSFNEAIKHRRSYYALSNEIAIQEQDVKDIIETALLNLPSSFNSQTTRIVLLLNDNHKEFWGITKDILQKIVPADAFEQTRNKIDSSFASGYGTILFYEDIEKVESLQKAFATYADRFPVWAEHTSAIHQFAIWTMLEDAGLGASLQHYNPLVDEQVAKRWSINPKWKLIAQMPFGKPIGEAGAKQHESLDKRFLVF